MSVGFTQGVANPCLVFQSGRKIRALVHGDDDVVVGNREQYRWLETRLD